MNGHEMKTQLKDELTDIFENRLDKRLQLFEKLLYEASKDRKQLSETIIQVKDYQKEQNGRTAAHTKKIDELDKTITESVSKAKGALWAFGVTGVLLLALVSTLYYETTSSLSKGIDTVNSALMAHIESTTK